MRRLMGFCLVLSLCGFAAGQDTWVPPGTYAWPSAPRIATPSASVDAVMTPSLSLDSSFPTVNGTRATAGNSAGATANSQIQGTRAGVQFNQPLWYAPGVRFDQPAYDSSTSLAQAERRREGRISPQLRGFHWGAATFQSSYGAAQLASLRSGGKATRAYTNSDVASRE